MTVTLDPQVAEWAREAADRQNRSLSAVINAALRSTLVHDSLTALTIDEEAELAAAYDDVTLTQVAEDDAGSAA
ncbi:hypothetical protein [Nocardia barduliensis]|uniref:hypothetical protein n=1 Tax=Nocardia barduliensis TaxID=2736643 RepID=UPI0028A85A60|nr:hypothetical protein [Nocardia barduliensis]